MKRWAYVLLCGVFSFVLDVHPMHQANEALKNQLYQLEQHLRALETNIKKGKSAVEIPIISSPAPQQEEIKKAIETWAKNFAKFEYHDFDMLDILILEGVIDKRGKENAQEVFSTNEKFLVPILESLRKIKPYNLNKDNFERIFSRGKFSEIIINPAEPIAPPLFRLTQLSLENLKKFYQDFLKSTEEDKIRHRKFFVETTQKFWKTLDEILKELRLLQEKYGIPYEARANLLKP